MPKSMNPPRSTPAVPAKPALPPPIKYAGAGRNLPRRPAQEENRSLDTSVPVPQELATQQPAASEATFQETAASQEAVPSLAGVPAVSASDNSPAAPPLATAPQETDGLPWVPAPAAPSVPAPAARSRRIEAHYHLIPQPLGLVQRLAPKRPAIALCLQYDTVRWNGGALQHERTFSPVLSISAAAYFAPEMPSFAPEMPSFGSEASGQRPADRSRAVCVLMPGPQAPRTPELGHVIAFVMRAAGFSPAQFRASGLDVYLFAACPFSTPAARAFGVTLNRAPLPWNLRLTVPDFAKRQYRVEARLHDLTPRLIGGGLRTWQILSGTSRPGPRHVEDVRQEMGALLRRDREQYLQVAAHGARLALLLACTLCDLE